MERAAPGSIGRRLTWTVLGTTALAVALACAFLAAYQARSLRATLVADLESLSEIIGFNAMLPLAAGDPGAVEATLRALTSNEVVEAAAVYAADARPFARFARDAEADSRIPAEAPAPGVRSAGNSMVLVREIAESGEVLGTVWIRVSTDSHHRQLLVTVAVAGGVFVLCLAPALLATARLRREIFAPLAALTAGAERVSAGDFRAHVAVRSGEETGVVAQAFNQMAERLSALIAEVRNGTHEVLENMKTLREANRRSREQALTQRSSVDRTSSVIERTEASLEAVGLATLKLSDCTTDTAASANQVDASTRNVRESIDVLFELIVDTASALSHSVESIRRIGDSTTHLDEASARTSNSVTQLAASIASVGEEASHGLTNSQETAERAQRGHSAVLETMEAIGAIDVRFGVLQAAISELAKSSGDIGDVLEVIDRVAAETNLLSLNASIVAAQAGEHGKPFAVVARRIGLLAERTSLLTSEIEKLVGSVQRSTERAVQAATEGSESVSLGVKLSHEAGEILARIKAAAEESARHVRHIAEAAALQGDALGEVGTAFHAVREGMLQIRSSVQEQGEATDRVHQTMQRTKDVADRVQRATDEQAIAVARIAHTIEEIHSVTQHVSDVTKAQSRDARQILHALQLFREIAGRNVEDAEAVQKVIDMMGQRAEALEAALGAVSVQGSEEELR